MDLVIESSNSVEKLEIINRTESDHLPVTFEISREIDGYETTPVEIRNQIKYIKWSGDKENSYAEEMTKRWEEEIMIYNGETNEKKWAWMLKTIWDISKKIDMLKIRGGEGIIFKESPEIRQQKKRIWRSLRRYLKSKKGGKYKRRWSKAKKN